MFEIINERLLNDYNVNTCHNGGGYYQYEISFCYEGISGKYRNTSCGDFGDRISIEIKKEGGEGKFETVYLFDQVDGGGNELFVAPLKETEDDPKRVGVLYPDILDYRG